MKKIIISIILAILFVFYCFPVGALANDFEYNECRMNVVWNGTSMPKSVLQREDGELYAPISWLTYFGLLKFKEENNKYVFYYADQEEGEDFAKRIFISEDGTDFSVCFYKNKRSFIADLSAYYTWIEESLEVFADLDEDSKTQEEFYKNFSEKLEESWNAKEEVLEFHSSDEYNAVLVYEGRFSDNTEYEDELYLPVAELLPLINAKIAVESNNIYINSNFVSLSQALDSADIGVLAFDADKDIAYKEVVSVGGYIVDMFSDFRFDRLDFISNSGRINDYEEIFKSYLTEDETYLSAYDKEKTPQAEAFELGRDMFAAGQTAYDLYDGITDFEGYYDAMMTINPDIYDILSEGSDIEIGGADILSGAGKVVSYWNTYVNQIEDHRNMLSAVYEYDSADKDNNTPSYQAAISIQKRYGEDVADLLLSNAKDGIEDCLLAMAEKGMEQIIPAPYTFTLNFTKVIVPEAFETIHNDSLIYVMDAAVEKSYDTFLSRKYSGEYDAKSLNELRLCAIMVLIASKHAYKTIGGEDYDKKIAEIDECLEKLYLAADGVECDSSDYYEKKCKELRESLKSWKPLSEEELEDLTHEKTDVKVLLSGIEAEEIQYAETDLNYNFCFIKRNGKWGTIDYEGNILTPIEYDYYSTQKNYDSGAYQAFVSKYDENIGYKECWIEKDGLLRIPEQRITGYGSDPVGESWLTGLFWDSVSNQAVITIWEYETGESVHTYSYEEHYDQYVGQKKIGIKKVIKYIKYEDYIDVECESEKYGIFDCVNGKMVTDFIYDDIECYVADNVHSVKQNDRWGYINDEYEMITSLVYDSAGSYTMNRHIIVQKDGMYGLINTNGETVVEPAYKKFSNVNLEGLCWVQEQDGTWSVIDVSK